MKTLLTYVFAFLLLNVNAQSVQEAVTNQTIIDLHKAQINAETIILKINSSICNFNLTTEGLIALKKLGVPDQIINAMLLKDATKPVESKSSAATPYDNLTPGIYYIDSLSNELTSIEPAVISGRSSGTVGEKIGTTFFGGINTKSKATLDNKESKQKLHTTTPEFIFVFDTSVKTFNNYEGRNNIYGAQPSTNVQSPNEFILLHLKSTKNSREFVAGKENSISSHSGIDNKAKLPFSFKKIKSGIYKVIVDQSLPQGEYAFMIAPSSGNSLSSIFYDPLMNTKVYDFSIK